MCSKGNITRWWLFKLYALHDRGKCSICVLMCVCTCMCVCVCMSVLCVWWGECVFAWGGGGGGGSYEQIQTACLQ